MRPTIDLLDLEFVFSQQTLLTPGEFIKAFEQRVLSREFCLSDWEQLEELHRIGAIIPIFRLEKKTRSLLYEARQRNVLATSVGLGQNISLAMNSYKEIGTLKDPQLETYKTWYSYIRPYRTDYAYPNEERFSFYWASSFFYSPYQLLLAPNLRKLISQMSMRRRNQRKLSNWKYRLRLNNQLQKEVQKEAEENRDLAIALTALEAKYLPRLKGHHFSTIYSGSDAFINELLAYQQSFDPAEMLNWIGWNADKVKQVAEKLLWRADRLDPLRDWYELVRMSHPDMLKKLRGDALIALDHRRTAELLFRFYEDLQAHNLAPPSVEVPKFVRHPHATRLKYDLNTLDEVLMKFGLSSQPALILIIEGDTEEYIIPKVVELLGIPQYSNFIQLFNIQGINKDFELLARYIIPFQLGDVLENDVLLTRPPTHFLVVVDAESKFKDSSKRQDKLNTWVEGIYKAIPEEYRTNDMKSDLNHFVHIETWNDDIFEFAHFTNEELALALRTAYTGAEIPSLDYLVTEVNRIRRRNDNKNIDKILEKWNYQKEQENPNYDSGREVGKTDLAIILWPVLERKIQEALEDESGQIPIVKILLKAEELAALTHRKDVVVRF